MSHSSDLIGSFERNIGGYFIYKSADCYLIMHAQSRTIVGRIPRERNIWQQSGQLKIWLMAIGIL